MAIICWSSLALREALPFLQLYWNTWSMSWSTMAAPRWRSRITAIIFHRTSTRPIPQNILPLLGWLPLPDIPFPQWAWYSLTPPVPSWPLSSSWWCWLYPYLRTPRASATCAPPISMGSPCRFWVGAALWPTLSPPTLVLIHIPKIGPPSPGCSPPGGALTGRLWPAPPWSAWWWSDPSEYHGQRPLYNIL